MSGDERRPLLARRSTYEQHDHDHDHDHDYRTLLREDSLTGVSNQVGRYCQLKTNNINFNCCLKPLGSLILDRSLIFSIANLHLFSVLWCKVYSIVSFLQCTVNSPPSAACTQGCIDFALLKKIPYIFEGGKDIKTFKKLCFFVFFSVFLCESFF
jgi:hypothetical protein